MIWLLIVLEAGSSRSNCSRVHFLVKTVFLVGNDSLLAVSLDDGRGAKSFCYYFFFFFLFFPFFKNKGTCSIWSGLYTWPHLTIITSLNALSPIQGRWRHVRALAYELGRGDTIQFLVEDTKKLNCCWSRAQLSTSYYDFLPPPLAQFFSPLRIMERMEKYKTVVGWLLPIGLST